MLTKLGYHTLNSEPRLPYKTESEVLAHLNLVQDLSKGILSQAQKEKLVMKQLETKLV